MNQKPFKVNSEIKSVWFVWLFWCELLLISNWYFLYSHIFPLIFRYCSLLVTQTINSSPVKSSGFIFSCWIASLYIKFKNFKAFISAESAWHGFMPATEISVAFSEVILLWVFFWCLVPPWFCRSQTPVPFSTSTGWGSIDRAAPEVLSLECRLLSPSHQSLVKIYLPFLSYRYGFVVFMLYGKKPILICKWGIGTLDGAGASARALVEVRII